MENADFVRRCQRRAGLDAASAEDAAQQVFLVAARKIACIEEGKARAFLYATAQNVAARQRRWCSRRREVELVDELRELAAPSEAPSLEELVDRRRAMEMVDTILAAMPERLADVFTLSELEERTAPDVAGILAIPVGTVASRLVRARAVFDRSLVRATRRRSSRAARWGASP